MTARHQKFSPVEEHGYFHISAAAASKTQLPTTPSAAGPALDLNHGQVLVRVVINDPGTSMVLALWAGNTANQIANIKATAPISLDFGCLVEAGIWYQYTGSAAGSITLVVLPEAV